MIQSLRVQKIRLPALAIGALGLVALASYGAPRLGALGASSNTPAAKVEQTSSSFAQRPIVVSPTADSSACGAGAYVTGDMAGDQSPAAVYASMCGGR